MNHRHLPSLALALAAACAGSNSQTVSESLTLTADALSIKTDGSLVHINAIAIMADGKPGSGSVIFAAPFGSLGGGGVSANVALDSTGVARVTFACNSTTDTKCGANASTVVTATWSVTARGYPITLGSSTIPPPGPGPTPGGTTPVATQVQPFGLSPNYLIVQSAASVPNNLPGSTTAQFIVLDQTGKAMPGVTVTVAEAAGENLVTVTGSPATTDASGIATVTITSKNTPGSATVHATVVGISGQASYTLNVTGAPSMIAVTAISPAALLGLAGSGIQENGQMTFKVTDAYGTPVPLVQVNFTQAAPNLVTLANASANALADGTVVAAYSAKKEVGVSAIIATVVAGGASVQKPIAVRGAKPSASGLYFRCAKTNLPVYTTTPQHEITTCSVALADRYGNRVGIPTQVSFGAEAGTISASVTTKAFDFADPNDPNEGTATVTFSSDMGNGYQPLDVAPLVADATQLELPRLLNEPSHVAGGITSNPRDQIVTLIAMVRGEETFFDANHNGSYDVGESFVDLSDPYIDGNDNNLYDPALEQRFCGLGSCAAFSYPNTQWDADTIIWAPTWVVFTGLPAAVGSSVTWAGTSCVDYLDNTGPNPSTIIGTFLFRDYWLNLFTSGTTYSNALANGAGLTLTAPTDPERDQLGAAGMQHLNWDYIRVSAADQTKPCAPGTACVMKLIFGDFLTGARTFTVADGNSLPAAASGVGKACPAPSANAVNAGFMADFTVTVNQTPAKLSLAGTYGK